ncbi:hypothetical protein CKO28_10075 [Rhodovibrio sodomensis]|uniref:Methyltransferase domain-containing protein n=1 Tax=Rhodovibrio sodomensis TaxID=1088 RepID=A0ABS1DEI0_9PROT|nr:methyltransferase domain-containing protein [Rhodovibrio sodomensis]MBK1668381.1 hypothetical protein [Rhodovibrio sodomensis]
MTRDVTGPPGGRPDPGDGDGADVGGELGPRLWDANARAWTRAVRERRIASRTAGTDAALLDTLARLAPGRLLDAGCGEGWLIRALRQFLPACRTIGVDGAPALVAAARAADPVGSYHHLTYDALAAGAWRRDPVLAERLADPLDAVVFNYALFDRQVGRTLQAARGLLAPGGALVIQTLPPCAPGAEGWRTEDFAGFSGGLGGGLGGGWVPMRWYARSRPAWDSALAEAGLKADTDPPVPDADALSLLLVARAA